MILRNRKTIETAAKSYFDLENFVSWFYRTFEADLDEEANNNRGRVRSQLETIWLANKDKS